MSKFQGWQRVPEGSRMVKGTGRSKDGKGYLKVQGYKRVTKDQILAEGKDPRLSQSI